jgi:lipopolysaccharide/colanic/teichoic acid biosynthesis glycosyltransferase
MQAKPATVSASQRRRRAASDANGTLEQLRARIAQGALEAAANEDAAALLDIPPKRMRLDPRAPVTLLRLIDWVAALAAVEAAALWSADASILDLPIGAALPFLAVAIALKAGLWLTESYRPPRARMRLEVALGGLALSAILGLAAAALLAPDARAASALAIAAPAAALAMGGVHVAFSLWASLLYRRGVFAETLAIVGASEAAAQLIAHAARTGSARVAGVFDDRPASAEIAIAGDIDALLTWEALPRIDRIVVAIPDTGAASVRAMLQRLRSAPNRIDILMDDLGGRLRGPGLARMPGGYAARVIGPRLDPRLTVSKRVMDIALALALLVFTLPATALITLLIWMENKSPLLARTPRLGLNNAVFSLLSFSVFDRSGRRLTVVGTCLRWGRLERLPRLLNVLAGDMSMVGPRPHPPRASVAGHAPRDLIVDYAHRHRVRPGLTGWAQINCRDDAFASPEALRRHTALDLDYAARPTPWLDIVILLRSLARPLS